MEDATSILDASAQAPVASAFDASQVDKNLKAIHAVQSGWRLPQLPDEVKLDLASKPGVTEDHINNLLFGLESDLTGDQPQKAQAFDTPAFPQFSTLDRTRRYITDLTDSAPPTVVDGSAVQRWKTDAIKKGYLDAPANGVIDNSWQPEFETIRKSMAYDDYNRAKRGEGFGSLPFSKVVDQIGKWTSPSGLMAAATNLDLMWDFGAVSHEFSTWGDKWRKVGKSKNPLDFAKNLVDAVTGPIDDVLMPVANWALLATGVGEAYNFARVAYEGGRIIAGAEAVEGLYKSSQALNLLTRGYDAAADVKRMTEASGLAARFAKSGNSVVSGVGDAMTAWRELNGVATSKKLIQTGMKLGLASQAEDLLPGYQGGKSLRDTAPAQQVATWADKNPFFKIGVGAGELFVAPYTVFKPGTFVGGGKGVIGAAAGALGTTAGKAALGGLLGAGVGTWMGRDTGDTVEGAAIGALGLASVPLLGKGLHTLAAAAEDVPIAQKIMPKSVGTVGSFLEKTSWKPLGDNQMLTAAFHQGMLSHLQGDELAKYQAGFNEKGFLGAFADHFGVDEESAGAAMGFVMTAAAIDHIASSQAKAAGTGSKFLQSFYRNKNKLIAQVRSFDLDNVGAHTLDEIAMASSMGVGGQKKEFASLRKLFEQNPALALEHANAHNQAARETLQQLLSVESVPDLNPTVAASLYGWTDMDAPQRASIIAKYLPQVMDSFGNWPEFSTRTSEIRGLLHDGLLDDAVFDSYRLPSGLVRPTLPARQIPVSVTPSVTEEISQGINDTVFRSPETDITKVTSQGRLGTLARGVDPSIGRFTVMRSGTADKGQIKSVMEELKELAAIRKTAIPRLGQLEQATTAAGADLTTLSKKQYTEIIGQVVKGATPQKEMRRVVDYAKRNGVPISEIKTFLDDAAESAVNDSRLTDWIGLPKVVTGKPAEGETIGAVLSGDDALKQRISDLASKANFTAARIDGDKLLETLGEGTPEYARMKNHLDSLDRDGYKLVHGVEYLMPEDLAHQTPIFEDINRRHQNAVTLGNFFNGREPAVARMAEQRRARLVLLDELAKRGVDKSLNDQDVSNMLEDLHSILRSEQALSEDTRTNAAMGSWLQKRIASVKTSTTPVTISDLGRTKWKRVIHEFEPVYGKEAADASAAALRRMRNNEFKDVGLYAIESHLRGQNQLASALKVLSGTEHGDGFLARSSTGRKVGAVAGGIYGAEQGGSDSNVKQALEGAAIGAAAGTVGQGLTGPLFAKAEQAFQASKWFQYGYLADDLAGLRDTMRFTLSPFFDLSRYTEGMMLGQTAAPLRTAEGERVVMPLNISPSKLMKTWRKTEGLSERQAAAKFQDVVGAFSAASRGETDFQAGDTMSSWFQQVGIVGFNPTNWMASAFHHLTEQGFEPRQAYEHVRDMYTYGTHGRSAAEQSVNFIFFPFSFQKKAYTHLAKYVSDDLSRAVVLHDALKGYELLNDKYNLPQMWRDHLPALEKLQQLNMFAFGLSPGRFGGINRPFIEPIMNMLANSHGKNEFVPGILNLFNPQGISVHSAADAANVTKLTRQLLPVVNDINHLLGDSKDQFHALTSASRQTYAADANDGWTAWADYRKKFEEDLHQSGYKMSDLNKPWMAETKMAYNAERAKLAGLYPGWGQSRTHLAEKNAALDMELQDRFDRVANNTPSEVDVMTYKFNQAVKAAEADIKLHGGEDFSDADTQTRQSLLDMASGFARGSSEWRRVYGKFFQRKLGPIEAEVKT
jgi:hypothetical protein